MMVVVDIQPNSRLLGRQYLDTFKARPATSVRRVVVDVSYIALLIVAVKVAERQHSATIEECTDEYFESLDPAERRRGSEWLHANLPLAEC
jgi:hypothetical protein